MKDRYEVIVIGGGHAGCEAAAAAARMGCAVALVTHRVDTIGTMSCNPAIGGVGKGHLVREIDALDGVMGLAADRAGIHFKTLNMSKGPAVRGPRAQADRKLYRGAVQGILRAQAGLSLLEGEVEDIRPRQGDGFLCVVLGSGEVLHGRAVVLTTGTFLDGRMYVGSDVSVGGRVGSGSAIALAQRLRSLGLPMGRLKTGTPPRLHRDSIVYEGLEAQSGEVPPTPFSAMTASIDNPQVSCFLTRTNAAVHAVIQENLRLSPMYSGLIDGVGPRYCPSLEDKVVRFGDRDSHQIFLEPEGLDSDLVYPNGISTAMPVHVQEAFVRLIPGLAQVRIVQPGYAVEYDFVDPRALGSDLGLLAMPGLYLAGQINGTTGYEEAAAQGLYAGINAALACRGSAPFYLDRADAYIGVLVDDLVNKGVVEPYRMFTSRAEYRLLLRADNADRRLTPRGLEVGCIGDARRGVFEARSEMLSRVRADLVAVVVPGGAQDDGEGVGASGSGPKSGLEILREGEAGRRALARAAPFVDALPPWILETVSADMLYEGYLRRQEADVRAYRRDETLEIGAAIDYQQLPGLSKEVRTVLDAGRPRTIGQAARLSGVTPSAINVLLRYVRREPELAE